MTDIGAVGKAEWLCPMKGQLASQPTATQRGPARPGLGPRGGVVSGGLLEGAEDVGGGRLLLP